jgi:hypothetical protein
VFPGPLDKIWRLAKMKLGIGRANLPTGHTPCVAALLKAIEAGGPLPMSPEEARRSLELCFAIYTAAITGEPVEFPLRDDSPFYAGVSVDDYQPGQPNKENQSVHA